MPRARKHDPKAHNAYRLRTDMGLHHLLVAYPDGHIRLRVFARDELSGIGRVFEAAYHEPETDIRRGKFALGQTFDVVPT